MFGSACCKGIWHVLLKVMRAERRAKLQATIAVEKCYTLSRDFVYPVIFLTQYKNFLLFDPNGILSKLL
jgi:hypothetical protein